MGMDPLLIGLLGVLFGAIIVAIFHCVIACYGPEAIRPAGATTTTTTTPRLDRRRHEDEEDEEDDGPSNNYPVLDLMVVSSYSNKECEEEVCAVCLNEFKEGDEVRVLPECCHVFHVLCIDKWLTSRGNCPLCRADTISAAVDAIPVTNTVDQSVPVRTDVTILS